MRCGCSFRTFFTIEFDKITLTKWFKLFLDNGWDGRIRTYGTLYQKQLPYHLATSQQWRDVYDGRAL